MSRLIGLLGLLSLLFALPVLADTANPRGPGGGGHRPEQHDPTLSLPFCGQGPNAGTNYVGPATGTGVDVTPGNATCDGYDNAGAAGADNIPLGMAVAYRVVGMACQITNAAGDDTVDMTLYDDTVAVSSVTCTITAAGGTETCTVMGTNATVFAGSLLAIEVDNDNDDMSADDVACWVFAKF